MNGAPEIGAHRLLGDGATAALLTPTAEIDWWCAPTFDSRPLLWSLLDRQGPGAAWCRARVVASSGVPAASALRTTVSVDGRRVECCDALLRRGDRGSAIARLVRLVDDGFDRVDEPLVAEHVVDLGGFDGPRARWHGDAAVVGAETWWLRGGRPVGGSVSPGRRRVAVGHGWSGLLLTPVEDDVLDVDEVLDIAARAARQADADERHLRLPRVHGERSLHAVAVLRACTDDGSGAVIASPTTSLPEALDGDRQYDYRYTWLRDSSLAAAVAAELGIDRVGDAHVGFLGSQGPDRLLRSPMSTTRGEGVPDEREVEGVEGWHGARPIRVGNDAKGQLQYDAIGTVLESLWVHARTGGRIDPPLWDVVQRLADRVVDPPDEPSSGVWELREPRWLVSADIGRWVALDRAVRIARRRRPLRSRRRRAAWRAARDDARSRVLGAIRPDGALPMSYRGKGADALDASALLAVVLGLLGPTDPRASRVVDATLAGLTAGPYLYRYEPGTHDGFRGREGAFVPASWWAVAALAAIGRVEEAERRADDLCAGLPALLPEEVDPASGRALGNVPLVWSHMEAARALAAIEEADLRRRFGSVGAAASRFVRSLRIRARRRRRSLR
ncbi:glycoside hydrolase family 15 protein [Dermatobacter hominis]|uniref:glycoside hydrolase family 15 protein n=1 Tax=Dermatobacter hominis TaxID=2884263 RepID=UPI001D12DF64|nr:glycoside hydrolase family 15 protein [Dermatobacter hominis]UDY37533.1 glycoside hydrolase family 15 protein [Dermatobacter hominis]